MGSDGRERGVSEWAVKSSAQTSLLMWAAEVDASEQTCCEANLSPRACISASVRDWVSKGVLQRGRESAYTYGPTEQ